MLHPRASLSSGDNVELMADGDVRVSVVVPTHNRSTRVQRLVAALAAQELSQPFEVVVVDDASEDDTVARLHPMVADQPFDLVLVQSAGNTGPAGARNRGWREARGEFIAFIDDDCVPDRLWLGHLVAGLDSAHIAIGRTRPPEDQLHLIGPFSSVLDIGHDLSYSTCNIAYRREVLEAMGGFNDDAFKWPNGEDTDLGLRSVKAGFDDRFMPEALVWHDVGPSHLKDHIRRLRRLDGIVTLVSLHPEARPNLNAGWFLRSVDKAVLIGWAAAIGVCVRPRSREARLFALVAAIIYVWQFERSHYRSRSTRERATSAPLGFLADSWAVCVMIRSSVRHRTLLL
jgi:GT2 family glycosyltransferase